VIYEIVVSCVICAVIAVSIVRLRELEHRSGRIFVILMLAIALLGIVAACLDRAECGANGPVELTRLRGHFRSYSEGVHHGKEAPQLPPGVPA
jgi:hypothetical protein